MEEKHRKTMKNLGVRGAGGGGVVQETNMRRSNMLKLWGILEVYQGALMMFCSKNTRVYSHSLTP